MVDFSAEKEHALFERAYRTLEGIIPRRKSDPDIYLSRSSLETRYRLEIDRGSSEPAERPTLLCREITRQVVLDTKKALIDTLSEAERLQRDYLSDFGIKYGFRAERKPLLSADKLRADFIGLDRKVKSLARNPEVSFYEWNGAIDEYNNSIDQLIDCIASINKFNVSCGKTVDDKRRSNVAIFALKLTATFSILTFIYRVLDDIFTPGGIFYWQDQFIWM